MSQVSVGTKVKLTGFVPGEEEVFCIVPEGRANPLENEISVDSPLARALEGAEVGDRVTFRPPAGEVELTVLEVGSTQ
jgi:transcription elongation factor GreA